MVSGLTIQTFAGMKTDPYTPYSNDVTDLINKGKTYGGFCSLSLSNRIFKLRDLNFFLMVDV